MLNEMKMLLLSMTGACLSCKSSVDDDVVVMLMMLVDVDASADYHVDDNNDNMILRPALQRKFGRVLLGTTERFGDVDGEGIDSMGTARRIRSSRLRL